MINIKGASGLAKLAINRIDITMTNCYQTADGQGPLLIYGDICPRAKYTDALQTAFFTKIVSGKELTDALKRCFWGVRFTTPEKRWCATLDKLMCSFLTARQIDRFLNKLNSSPWFRSLIYYINISLSQPFRIISLLKPNPVEVKATQNGRKTEMKMEKTWLHVPSY